MAKHLTFSLRQSIKDTVGDLDKVKRVVKLLGFVDCAEDFANQSRVMNGASDLRAELYGERRRHARAAAGMYQPPFGVEVEMIVAVEG